MAERASATRLGDEVASEFGAAAVVAGEAVGRQGPRGDALVSPRVAAVAATLAAADRDANYRFEADTSTGRSEARPLTRREKEGLKRRVLAEKSLVASTSWVNKPAATMWRMISDNKLHAGFFARRLFSGLFKPQTSRCILNPPRRFLFTPSRCMRILRPTPPSPSHGDAVSPPLSLPNVCACPLATGPPIRRPD